MSLEDPLNDKDCLNRVHERVRRNIAHAVHQEFARKFKKHEIAPFLRRLPRRLDHGDPHDGPRIDCTPSQRLRHLPGDPNCFEVNEMYLTIAEIVDPDTPRTSCTIRVGRGYHTFPVEQGEAVILDPYPPPRNAIDAGIYTCERRNGLRPCLADSGDGRLWLIRVAMNAARSPWERQAVCNAIRAVNRAVYSGEPLRDLYAIAQMIALAETEVGLWGQDGHVALAKSAQSLRNLQQRTDLGTFTGLAKRIGERALEALILSQAGPVGLVLLNELRHGGSAGAAAIPPKPAQPSKNTSPPTGASSPPGDSSKAASTDRVTVGPDDPLSSMSLH